MSNAHTPLPANDGATDLNRRQRARRRTRAKVLEAGKLLFEQVGYERATIRAVAAQMGMSTGAFFNSFTDKADLYRAVYGHEPITPEQGRKLADALRAAEAFIAGFEGDELQDGIGALLTQIRSALDLDAPIAPAADTERMAA